MPQDRTPQLSFNLSRRLISIFLVSVLAVMVRYGLDQTSIRMGRIMGLRLVLR